MKKFLMALMIFLTCGLCFSQDITGETVPPVPRSSTVIFQELRTLLKNQQDVLDQKELLLNDSVAKIQEMQSRVDVIEADLEKSLREDAKKSATIIAQNEKLRLQTKVMTVLVSVLGLFTLVHFAILVLNLKFGIKLPYWLNTIL